MDVSVDQRIVIVVRAARLAFRRGDRTTARKLFDKAQRLADEIHGGRPRK